MATVTYAVLIHDRSVCHAVYCQSATARGTSCLQHLPFHAARHPLANHRHRGPGHHRNNGAILIDDGIVPIDMSLLTGAEQFAGAPAGSPGGTLRAVGMYDSHSVVVYDQMAGVKEILGVYRLFVQGDDGELAETILGTFRARSSPDGGLLAELDLPTLASPIVSSGGQTTMASNPCSGAGPDWCPQAKMIKQQACTAPGTPVCAFGSWPASFCSGRTARCWVEWFIGDPLRHFPTELLTGQRSYRHDKLCQVQSCGVVAYASIGEFEALAFGMNAFWQRDSNYSWTVHQVPWEFIATVDHPVSGQARVLYDTGGTFAILGAPADFASCASSVLTANGGYEHVAMKAPDVQACVRYDNS